MTTAQQPTGNRSSQEMVNVDERLRQAILDKRQAQIAELSERMDQLQNQTKHVAENLGSETERKLNALKEARQTALSRLDDLRQGTQDNWAGLLEQADQALQSMSDRFHAFVNSQT